MGMKCIAAKQCHKCRTIIIILMQQLYHGTRERKFLCLIRVQKFICEITGNTSESIHFGIIEHLNRTRNAEYINFPCTRGLDNGLVEKLGTEKGCVFHVYADGDAHVIRVFEKVHSNCLQWVVTWMSRSKICTHCGTNGPIDNNSTLETRARYTFVSRVYNKHNAECRPNCRT